MICYQYGLTGKEGGLTEGWSVWQNEGWAWSCATEVGDRIFVGSYFGRIYELFRGDAAEPNPDDPDTVIPIRSCIETGDWEFGDLNAYKALKQLFVHWNILGTLEFDLTVYYNGAEDGETYPGLGEITAVARWDEGEWDEATWNGLASFDIDATPPGGGKQIRLKFEWDSLVNGVINRGFLYGLSGLLQLGQGALKYRK